MPIKREELRKLKLITGEDDERLKKEARREYDREYHEVHKEEAKEYNSGYYKEHREEMKMNTRQNYKENREEKIEHIKECYIKNKEKMDERSREYRSVHSKEICERVKKWQKDNPGVYLIHCKRSNAKRKRELGYEEILPAQWSCVQHHVDDERVIPIPEVVHRMFSGHSREEHRRLVDEWMREIRPDLWLLVHIEDVFEGALEEMIERNKRKE